MAPLYEMPRRREPVRRKKPVAMPTPTDKSTDKSSVGLTQTAILVCLGVVVVIGVIGSVFAGDNVVQILGFCSMISVALIGMLQAARAEAKADVVASKVEEVAEKATLVAQKVEEVAEKASVNSAKHDGRSDERAAATMKKLDNIEVYVNSRYGLALGTIAEFARAKAERTGLAEDLEKSLAADADVLEHKQQQIAVEKTTPDRESRQVTKQ